MTIKEMEDRTGMERANIRFYEKEGLLSPSRLANGYRDYSEEDVETLMRIKLLRSLRMPLEDIRALQLSEKTLSDTLRMHLQRLTEEKELLSAAENVCRTMQTDCADYTTLNAHKYLEQLENEPPSQQTTRPSIPITDTASYPAYPWRRFFARSLDYSLYLFPMELFYLLVLRLNPNTLEGEVAYLACTALAYGIMLFIEPVLLHTFGTTPGKWLFGLRITNGSHNKLSYSEGLQRTWGVFCSGYGLFIPIYNIYRQLKCYKLCASDEPCPWDEYAPHRQYTIRDAENWRVVTYIAAALVLFFCTTCAEEASAQPPNSGQLTIAQYAENYNFFSDYYNDTDWFFEILPDGNWAHHPETSEFTDYYGGGVKPPRITYTTDENGYVTGIEIQDEDAPLTWLMYTDVFAMSAVSLIDAQPSQGILTYRANRVVQQLSDIVPMDFEFSESGIHVQMDAIYEQDAVSYRFTVTKE